MCFCRNRAGLVNCVQKSSGKTGVSFGHVELYLQANKPPMFLLENVGGLLQKVSTGEPSDAEYICSKLQDLLVRQSQGLH